jgi:tellurite resistance protein TerC
MMMETIGTWWMWVGFAVFVVVAIAVDLLVMEKQGAHKVTMKEAALWSVLWFSLSFLFVVVP